MKTPHPASHLVLVKGMSCQHCVKAVTNAIQEQDPQAKVSVELTDGRVSVDTVLPLASVLQLIEGEGYEAKPASA